jgi:hypothetical protein
MKDKDIQLAFSAVDGRTISIPEMVEKKLSGKGYVGWGEANEFPQYLFDLYNRSSLLQSIIDGICDFVEGKGLTKVNPKIKADKINRDGDTLLDLISKIDRDLQIFGGFAMNVLFDYEHNISELYWVDIQKVRVDEFERIAYISDKWSGYGVKPIEIPIYDKERVENSWKTEKPINSCLFYYKGKRTRGIYPISQYNGALTALETAVEISKFHLNNILNNLEASAVFAFNNGTPTEEEKKKLSKEIKERLAGAENAGKFILLFADDKDHGVEITRLAEDNMDRKFELLQESTMKEIYTAFRATPTLFGLQAENNGFSKEEFLQAFELFNETKIIPIQKEITRVFDKLYDVEQAFEFIPFSLGVVNNITEEDA